MSDLKAKEREAEKLVEQAVALYAEVGEWTGIPTGWVLCAAWQDVSSDGDMESGVSYAYPQGSMPWPTALGIIRAVQLRQEHLYLHREDDE